MKEPTRVQIKEFWEGCGFKYEKIGQGHQPEFVEYFGWVYPDGGAKDVETPAIDLNNLFKYAEPKAIDQIMAEQECGRTLARAILFKKWTQNIEDGMDTEDALFWALWEVKEKSDEQG